MSTRRKLCNLCKAELEVPLKAQLVECPVCRSINSYGALTSQYDNYAKAPPSKMNTGGYGAPLTSQYDNYPASPPSKMNTGIPNNRYQQEQSFQTPPQRQTSSVHAPPRDPPLSSPGGTEPLSFKLPGLLPQVRTKGSYQESLETSSPQGSPHPAHGNTYFQQEVQPSPQSSPHPDYSSTYFQQLQPSPQNSPRPDYSSTYFQQPQPSPQSSSRPQVQTSPPQESSRPLGTKSFLRPPQTSPPAQTSPPPSTQISPPVQTSPPQGSPHSNNNFYRFPVQTPIPKHISPPAQTHPSLQTSPPQGSPRPLGINNHYRPPTQTPTQIHISPPVQISPPQASTRPNSFYRPPAQTSPPLGSLHPAHSNGYHQQPLQASSPHSSLTPTDGDDYYQQQPSPHASPPRVHSSGYYQKPQPFPPISRPQVNTSGYYQQPLQDSRPVSSRYVSPVLVHSSTWEDQRIQYAGYKGTRQGTSVSLGAYEDHQKSGATTAFTGNSSGALPYSFIQTAKKDIPTSTYEHVLNSICNIMSESGASTGRIREI